MSFSYNKLTKLPELPNCIQLHCSYNQLTTLPELPKCIELHCHGNVLTTLPELPNCEKLECSENQLTKLPELPNCKKLECRKNQLTTLPELPKYTELTCDNNQLTKLPELSKYELLYCYNNKLTTLPELPKYTELICDNNQLTKLPELPNCENINCSNNLLNEHPELLNCIILDCYKNKLTTLPELPNCEYINCNKNKLTKLPELPNCKKLECKKNQLTTLPELPNCYFLDCSNNLLNERPRLIQDNAEIIDDNNLYNKNIDIYNNSDSDIIIKFLNENISKMFMTYNATGPGFAIHKVSGGWDFLQISINLYKYQKNINNSYIFDKKDNFREYLTTTLNSFYNKTGNNSNKSNTNNTKKDTEDINFKRFNTDATKTEIINRIYSFIDNKENNKVKDCIKILITLVFDYITKQTDKLKLLYFKSFIIDVCNAYNVSQESINKSIEKRKHCPGISCNQGIVERIIQNLQTIINTKESINKYEQQILCSFSSINVEDDLKYYINKYIQISDIYNQYGNNANNFNKELIKKIKTYIDNKLNSEHDPCITEDKKTEYKSYNNNRKILDLLIKTKKTYKFIESIYDLK